METLESARFNMAKGLPLYYEGREEDARPYLEEARRLFEETIEAAPDNAEAHARRAQVLHMLGQYADARATIEQARQLDPDDEMIADLYNRICSAPASAPTGGAGEQLEPERLQPSATSTVAVPEVEEEEQVWTADSAPPQQVSAAPPAEEPEPDPARQDADGYWALGMIRLQEENDRLGAKEAFLTALDLYPRHVDALQAYCRILLEEESYSEAREYLDKLEAIEPAAADKVLSGLDSQTGDLLVLQSWLQATRGKLEAAEEKLQQALSIQPERADWIVEYAHLLSDESRWREATSLLHNAIDRGIQDASLHVEYARLMARQRRYDEVETHLRRAEEIEPGRADTKALRQEVQEGLENYNRALRHTALARMRIRQGLHDEARREFERALAIDGDHLPALKAYAQFLEDSGDYDEAEKMWAMVGAQAPAEAEAHFQALLAARGENSETLNHLARILAGLDRLEESERTLRRSLELGPVDPGTITLLTGVLRQQGRAREAEDLLATSLAPIESDSDLEPSVPHAHLSLDYAKLLANRGDYGRARRYYALAQKLAPFDEEIEDARKQAADDIARFERANREMALGWMDAREGRLDTAARYYESALEISPQHVPTLRRYTDLLEEGGEAVEASKYMIELAKIDPVAAEEHYCQRLATNPHDYQIQCAYGLLLQHLRRPEEAMAHYEKALAASPAFLPALGPYVGLLVEAEEMQAVERALDDALRADAQRAQEEHTEKGTAEIPFLYAQLLVNRRRYGEAKSYFDRAIKFSDHAARYVKAAEQHADRYARFYEAEGAYALALELVDTDAELAEQEFQKALETDPEHVPALVEYGKLLLQQRRWEDASEYLWKAVELDPYDQETVEMAGHLKAKLERAPLAEAGAAQEIETLTIDEADGTEEEGTPDG